MSKKQLSKIANSFFWSILGVFIIFIAIFIPFLSMGNFKWNFKAEVDATIVNGILTSDAIIFGFVTFELRKIGKTMVGKFLLSIPLLLFLAWTVDSYFMDAISLGYPTVNTVIVATITFFYNILHYAFMLFFVKVKAIEI